MGKMICQSTVINTYGFTKELIELLLPEPVKKQNPRYKNAPDMLLWEEDLVKQATKTDEFVEAVGKKVKRNRARKTMMSPSLITKRFELTQVLIDKFMPEPMLKQTAKGKIKKYYYSTDAAKAVKVLNDQIDAALYRLKVVEVPEEALRAMAVGTKEIWETYCENSNGRLTEDMKSDDRLVVDLIRNTLTNCDDFFYNVKGTGQLKKKFIEYHNKVLDAIAESYPYLKDCCEEQKKAE